MHDPLEDLIDNILNEPPKSQSDLTGTSSFQAINREDSENDRDLTYRRVTVQKNLPTCGTCRKQLNTGEKHWHYRDDIGEVYWWCYDCMASVNCLPDEEEMKRADQ